MPELTIYDIGRDERRPATQEDIEQMQAALIAMAVRPQPVEPQISEEMFDFELAIYLNPMRRDGVFVAERKPIEPYDPEHIRGLDDRPLYPATPQTPWAIRAQLPPTFAAELVIRWNAYEARKRAARAA